MSRSPAIHIGRTGRAHGLAGEVRVHILRRYAHVFPRLDGVLLTGDRGEERRARIVGSRLHQDVYLVRFDAVSDRTGAETLRNHDVAADREALERAGIPPPFPEDFVGLAVITTEGIRVGVVEGVDDFPAGDMLRVVDGDSESLIPAVPEIVTAVDLDEGTITVDPPPGLLDINRGDGEAAGDRCAST